MYGEVYGLPTAFVNLSFSWVNRLFAGENTIRPHEGTSITQPLPAGHPVSLTTVDELTLAKLTGYDHLKMTSVTVERLIHDKKL